MNQILQETVPSTADGLPLYLTFCWPAGPPVGLLQISHGMAEHRARYLELQQWFAGHGWASVIHDHRGHGESLRTKDDRGYLYPNGAASLTADLHQINEILRQRATGLPLVLLGHSMGSLVARAYLKQYPDTISGLCLSGPPTQNKLAGCGLVLAKLLGRIQGGRHRSRLLHRLVFGRCSKGHTQENAWLCSDPSVVEAYQADPDCGFVFTINGFEAVFRLMKDVFSPAGWKRSHLDLPIFFAAGADDPVIQSPAHFQAAQDFLRRVGYYNVSGKLYPGKRHELLNETNRHSVYQDLLDWMTAEAT